MELDPATGRPARTPARMHRRRSYGASAAAPRPFEQPLSLSVGVAEELFLLDPHTLAPAPLAERVLRGLRGDRRFRQTAHAAQLEVVGRPALTALGAVRELAAGRATLLDRLGATAALAASGTVPTARRTDAPCAGLRVHVAVTGADRALTIYNAARSYLPEIAALAANSPFLDGCDTGLASTRLKLTERYPGSGIPPAFGSWAMYEAYGRGRPAGVRQSAWWWDLRLCPRHGTIEFRVADAQTLLRDVGAVAAVCQALVAELAERYDRGEALAVHESHRIAENRWRALHDGLAGELVDLSDRRSLPTRERVVVLLGALRPYGDALGCADQLGHASSLASENGAARQRAAVAASGVASLAAWLVARTGWGA